MTIPPLPSPIKRTRSVKPFIQTLLFVRAAGRCQFAGCNKNVLQHEITLRDGNYAQMAHVVAFQPDGPRGREGERPTDINAIENLMLLCPACHKEVDDHPAVYPRTRLEGFKSDHEERVERLTELGPELRTATLAFKAPIGGQPVEITAGDIRAALLPRYPVSRNGTTIDLNDLAQIGEMDTYLSTATALLETKIAALFDRTGEPARTGHLSVFAIGPIPLLVHLGSRLTNKVPMDFFQRHRDAENWTWKATGRPARYRHSLVRKGTAGGGVGLILSLSGKVPLADVVSLLGDDAWIYELTLEGQAPTPTFLKQRLDLEEFRVAYQAALGEISSRVGLQECVHLFPAVPAPIAVLCGRERLPKVHPALRVYDYDRSRGGFTYRLRVE